MAFAGVSGSVLHTRVMQNATMSIEEPLVKELKLTLGAEIQTTGIVRGAKLLPRFGVYTAFTRNYWQHRFTPGAPKAIEGFQWEAAAYVSGHLISGLNALVSVGLLRPYGHDRGIAGIISVAPSIGAVLGGS